MKARTLGQLRPCAGWPGTGVVEVGDVKVERYHRQRRLRVKTEFATSDIKDGSKEYRPVADPQLVDRPQVDVELVGDTEPITQETVIDAVAFRVVGATTNKDAGGLSSFLFGVIPIGSTAGLASPVVTSSSRPSRSL